MSPPDYFHVGYHKVASTFLQSQIFPNLPADFCNVPADTSVPISATSIISASTAVNNKSSKIVYSDNRLTGDMARDDPRCADIVWHTNSKAKVLICIRSQYSALRSYYFTASKNGFAGSYKDFILYLSQNEKLNYYKMISAYYDRLGPENVTILFYEDFVQQPETFLRNIARFLDIEEFPFKDISFQPVRRSPGDLVIDSWNTASRIKSLLGVSSKKTSRIIDYLIVSPGFLAEKNALRLFGKKLNYRSWDRWNEHIDRGYGKSNRKLFDLLNVDINNYKYPQ